ncbi:MAG: GAF domain-containing protein, partial [Actinobacteria bacterium]|nr:GAF domain-containing protein [Actinomycetota bacterium]
MAQGTRPARASDELEQWQSLLRVSTDDHSADTLVETLHRVVDTARDLLGCRYAVLGVVDDTGALEHLVPAGADPRKIKPIGRRPLRDGVLGAVIVDSRTIRLPGPDVDARSIGLPAGHPVASSLLGVPIRSEGRTVGALYLSQPEGDRPFTAADEDAAALVAAAAATAIRRAREAEQQAHRRRWAAEAAQLTRRLLAEVHDEPLRLVVERVHEVAGADLVTVIGRRDEDGYDIRDAAGPAARSVRGQVVESTRSVAAEVMRDATPRLYPDLVTHFPGSVVVERMPFDTALVVPFNGPELGRGALVLLRGAGRPVFTHAELEAITDFAAQIAVALELVRTRDRRSEVAVHDERDRIARDLHDHVIQRLFAIGLAVQSVGAGLDGEAGRRLLAGVDDIDTTIAQIRSTIYQLTGPVLAAQDSLREQVVQLMAEMEP